MYCRCEDCDIAFRIHGHLAKHLRSKSHVTLLEKLEKVPQGTYAQLEKHDQLGTLNHLSFAAKACTPCINDLRAGDAKRSCIIYCV